MSSDHGMAPMPVLLGETTGADSPSKSADPELARTRTMLPDAAGTDTQSNGRTMSSASHTKSLRGACAWTKARIVRFLRSAHFQAATQRRSDQRRRLVVLTLNMQYYSSYPDDREAACEAALRSATCVDGGDAAADVIAVQEGLADKDVLTALGYELVACSGKDGMAQTVREMVYGDEAALRACPEHLRDRKLCNQVYLRRDSPWQLEETDVEQISSALELKGSGGRCAGLLATRSVVWARLRRKDVEGAVYVMCTHISGGRFEDQYFVQQLAKERRVQTERCVTIFDKLRARHDCAIIVGDFNALERYEVGGPMQGYYKCGVATSSGVQADATEAGLETPEALEDQFKEYMVSPFIALREAGWDFAYGEEVGASSSFGHLVDHMATSRRLEVEQAELKYLTNQKFGDKQDTEVPLTDHNAIKVSFIM